ncbi:MAG: FKBP-type peptidyl-prolyl cis-trans isomerase [Candidatus Kapabacteria bacterium]|nr:FKBP-type peptidyl-prolyl cis-trans isomerase [Candidatus Kapabacteria bacterium]
MQKIIILAFALIAGLSTAEQATAKQQVNSVKPKSSKDTASYAVGMQIGKSLKDQGLDLDIDQLVGGLRDMVAGKALLTDAELTAAMTALQQAAMAKQQEVASKKGEINKVKGEAFLAENKKKPGVMVTPSGLQYKVLVEGKGKKPTKENKVKVHYTGKLIDGTVFDSSVERGEPIEFPLSGVIAGWTEGVQLMPVGSKYMFYIPSNLAYGTNGAGQSIGPNETLTFEVELLDITK